MTAKVREAHVNDVVRRCRLTSAPPRVLKALGFNFLKVHPFQAIGFKCQPAPPYHAVVALEGPLPEVGFASDDVVDGENAREAFERWDEKCGITRFKPDPEHVGPWGL